MAKPSDETTVSNHPKEEIELTETDIPGAHLEEPLEKHSVKALKWWLLCHGDSVPTSLSKMQLVER